MDDEFLDPIPCKQCGGAYHQDTYTFATCPTCGHVLHQDEVEPGWRFIVGVLYPK